jgi:hypothetical protein
VIYYYVIDDETGEMIEIFEAEAVGRLCIMSEFDMNAPCKPIDRNLSDPPSVADEV